MCKLFYFAHSCGCQHYHQQPDYCDEIKKYHVAQGGSPEWKPILLVKDAPETVNYKMEDEIIFQTADLFQPIRDFYCADIKHVPQDTKEKCPWHEAERTATLRAEIEERSKDTRKRQEIERRNARWREAKRRTKAVLGAVFYPLNTR